jgi:hypothetical protein
MNAVLPGVKRVVFHACQIHFGGSFQDDTQPNKVWYFPQLLLLLSSGREYVRMKMAASFSCCCFPKGTRILPLEAVPRDYYGRTLERRRGKTRLILAGAPVGSSAVDSL